MVMFSQNLRRIVHQIKRSKLRDVAVPPREEFVDWLRFAVPGMTAEGNERAFEYVAANLNGTGSVVEIGSFCGLSTILIGNFLDKYDKKNPLFTCDKWVFEGQKLGKPLGGSNLITHDDYKAYVKDSYLRNVSTFLGVNKPYTIEAFSDEFFELWSSHSTVNDVFGRSVTLGGEISFCFIDGNHEYEFAKRDFLNTEKFLIKGGFILLDDSADGTNWGVNQLAKEIRKEAKYELVAQNPNYLFRKK